MSFKQVQAACSYRVWLTLWANEKKNLYFEVSDVVLVCARRWLVKRPISSTHLSLVWQERRKFSNNCCVFIFLFYSVLTCRLAVIASVCVCVCVWNDEGGDITFCGTSQVTGISSSCNNTFFGTCRIRYFSQETRQLFKVCTAYGLTIQDAGPLVTSIYEGGSERFNVLNDLC